MKKIIQIFSLVLLLAISTSPVSAAVTQQQISGNETLYLPVISVEIPPPVSIGPFGGSIVCISYQPLVQGLVFAGTWGSGVYKSTDGGVHWMSISAGLDNLYINSMATDPSNANVVYAGTYTKGIYKSVNGGLSWTAINSGIYDTAIVYTIAVDPHDSNKLYVGTRPDKDASPWGSIAYRSTNGGASWSAMLSNVGGSSAQDWIYSIAVNQVDSNRVLAASHEHGPYLSTDYGQTWQSVAGSIDGSGRAVVFDPRFGSPFTAFYGVWHLNGVYKTSNSAANWSQYSNGLGDAKIYSMGLSISKTNPNVLYAASFYSTYGLYKTNNAASNWSPAGFKGMDIYSVAISPQTTDEVLVGSVGKGLYRSTDGGQNWTSENQNVSNTDVTAVLSHAGSPGELVASVPGQGVLHTTDTGATWDTANSGLGDLQVNNLTSDPSDPDILYALTASDGLYSATWSGGLSWTLVSAAYTASTSSVQVNAVPDLFAPVQDPAMEPNPNPETQAVPPVSAALLTMNFAPSDSSVVYLDGVSTGIYKSTDGGQQWSQAGLDGQTVQSLVVDPDDPDRVYAATNASGASVQASNDGGATWSSSGLSGVTVSALAMSPLNTRTLYAATTDGIYRLDRDSDTWSPSGLNGQIVTALGLSPTRPSFLLAGTQNGLYQSNDGGQTWSVYSTELSSVTVRSIVFDTAQPGTVYICTTTQGIIKIGVYS